MAHTKDSVIREKLRKPALLSIGSTILVRAMYLDPGQTLLYQHFGRFLLALQNISKLKIDFRLKRLLAKVSHGNKFETVSRLVWLIVGSKKGETSIWGYKVLMENLKEFVACPIQTS